MCGLQAVERAGVRAVGTAQSAPSEDAVSIFFELLLVKMILTL